jgi:hypothetical protein
VADVCPDREIVVTALAQGGLPATPEEVQQGIATQIFGVVGSSDLPVIWSFAHSLPLQLMLALPFRAFSHWSSAGSPSAAE